MRTTAVLPFSQRAEGRSFSPRPAPAASRPAPSPMEALRAAGRAVLRSPSLARHRLGVSRLRLRQVPAEPWTEMREPLLDGRGFALKYLGMTLVETPRGEDMAAAAVRRIVAMARVGPKKFQKVILTVSSRGLSLQDAETKETIENISIYRISYCTTDKLQNKVFAYVAQNPQNGALECHAFLSPKKKIAQAVTLTVAQAFQVALDLWEAAQAGSREEGSRPRGPAESACLPARPPLGSPPFRTNFQEEEEEDEEEEDEEDLQEAFAGWGGAPLQKLPSCAFPVGGSLGMQPPQQLPASRGIFLSVLLPRPSQLTSGASPCLSHPKDCCRPQACGHARPLVLAPPSLRPSPPQRLRATPGRLLLPCSPRSHVSAGWGPALRFQGCAGRRVPRPEGPLSGEGSVHLGSLASPASLPLESSPPPSLVLRITAKLQLCSKRLVFNVFF